MSAEVSVIIVSWNTRGLLAGCLESLNGEIGRLDGLGVEAFVVDNASSDGSAAMVREDFPWVRLIESPENRGFAGGSNLALVKATGRYLLLLNPDTVLEGDTIARLRAALGSCPKLAAVGAQLVNRDGTDQDSDGTFPSMWTEIPLVNRLAHYRPRPAPSLADPDTAAGKLPILMSVDWASGAALMIRAEALAHVGLLDEGFWLYTEEADWCFRARRAGWEIALAPDVRVRHFRRAASRQNFVESLLHFHRSRLLFVRKHRGRGQATVAYAVLRLKAILWVAAPSASPLARAFPDLSQREVRDANRRLLSLGGIR
jgi:N-acetylglucosaminyl-diphospho-decaprenol L-rhamnosyltransferase